MKLNWIIPLFAAAGLALAGCGGGGSSGTVRAPITDPVPDLAAELKKAQAAAAAAAAEAMAERDAAQSAVDGLEDKKDDDVPNYTRAMDALEVAKAAYAAAKAASDAAAAATATAEGVDEAKKQQGIAEAEKLKAMAAKVKVAEFAGEATKLATAKAAAMTAAEAAREAARMARETADKVKMQLGADSAQYTAADQAATAAEAAADAAEAASANAQADTASADAEHEQRTAEGKQDEAETKLADVAELAREAGVAVAALNQLRIEQAQEAAETAKTAAMEHATSARSKATMARAEAMKARAAANKAMRARTNYAEANKQATAAEAAATAAEAAATAAEAAYMASKAAYMASKADDVTAETAREQRDEAQKQQRTADTGDDGANAEYMAAKAAAMEAATAAGMYALELFKVASGQGLADAEKKARVEDVAAEIRKTGNEERDGFGSTGTGKSFTLNSNGTGGPDNSVDGRWQIESNDNDQLANNAWGALVQHPLGKGRVYRFGQHTNELLRTPDPKVTTEQATQLDLPMLGDFTGVELSKGTLSAHIYTDYDPSKRKAATAAGNISGVLASSGMVSGTFDLSTAGTITAIVDSSKFTAGGITYTTSLTLTCEAPADCSYASTGPAATATITSLGSGWRVAGSAAAVPEAGDPDYMTFGYWLDLSRPAVVALTDLSQRVGVFAGGNNFPSAGPDQTALTGKATYRGSAAGMHAMTGAMEAVQPFDARAELTADFGTATELGGVKGRIYEINSGGTMLTGGMSEITLAYGAMDSATSRAATEHNARMGTPTVDPTDASATYPINGFWHARLSIATAESDDAAKRYPTSAIGTFGVSGTLDMGTADDMDDDVTHSLIGAFGTKLEQ